MSAVTIHQVGVDASVSEWISVPKIVHADDPHFVAQLNILERFRISKRFSPFFQFGDAAFFVARRQGRPVGRISAQVNRLHRARQDPNSGHFGLFSCLDDEEAARALFGRARTWLSERGATSISGPFSLSINEESGLLVEGFDEAPAMLMDHARPYMGALVEKAGLEKVMDTFAFRKRSFEADPRMDRLASAVEASGAITLRMIRVDRFEEEIQTVVDIFNDAWQDNWDFIPMSDIEIRTMARELKPFYAPEYGRIAEYEGRPIGFALAIPDINGIIKPYAGALLPFNWLRMLLTLKRRRFRSMRIPLMGVRREFHRSMISTGVNAMLGRELTRQFQAFDVDWVEFSWVLETNRTMLGIAELLAGKPVKRYRLYRGPIRID